MFLCGFEGPSARVRPSFSCCSKLGLVVVRHVAYGLLLLLRHGGSGVIRSLPTP